MEKRNAYFEGGLKIRAEDNGEKYIEGYFAVFNQETELWKDWFEQIAPGAFANSLQNNDIRCLFNHNTDFVMGRMSAGTLELKEDTYGLWGRVKINERDSAAMDVYERVARGDITGCSFGFYPISEEKRIDDNDAWHWTVKEADTSEVSICPFPAYPQTEIQARSSEQAEQRKQKLERQRKALKEKLEAIVC